MTIASYDNAVPWQTWLGVVALLVACGPAEQPTIEERYIGDVDERCAVSFGQSLRPRPDFELVLSTEDETHYRTNIPTCEPDAVVIAPGMLELVESVCSVDEEGEVVRERHLVEGTIAIDDDSASLFYRWTAPGLEGGMMSRCEVDNVLMRAD